MYVRILNRIRRKVRQQEYIVLSHARDEMNKDELTIDDVEQSILAGIIVERQTDVDTGEFKYLIRGDTIEGDAEVESVVKISPTGKVVVITVYMIQ